METNLLLPIIAERFDVKSGNPPGRVRTVRLVYFMAGIGISAWAVTVPFAKIRFGLDNASLGLILLGPGLGGILAMPAAGICVSRLGSKRTLILAGVVFGLMLPLLAIAPSPALFTVLLALFGAVFAVTDIAMNAQAVTTETRSGGLLMSSFHAMYSIGTLTVAAVTSFLLRLGVGEVFCAVLSGSAVFVILAQHRFLQNKAEDLPAAGPAFAWPNRATVVLGVCCFACFMTEGAVTDWSTIFLRFSRGVGIASAFYGYVGFAVAMAVTRLVGDGIAARFGKPAVMWLGSLMAGGGMMLAVLSRLEITDVVGFALVGLGIGNVAPLVLSAAARVKGMSPAVSVPAVMTLGYAGFEVGPVMIGFVADKASLGCAFGLIAVMLGSLSFAARAVE